MMLNRQALLDVMTNRVPLYEQVEDSIYRFERRHNGFPLAVYFLDLTERLPESLSAFEEYQDRVVGRYYFQGEKSLQWSNYLFFVVSGEGLLTEEVGKAKRWIEADRRYARKFVLAPEELETLLRPTAPAPTLTSRSENVLSIWTNQLEQVGIYDAVMSEQGVQARVEMIQNSRPITDRTVTQQRSVGNKYGSFIRSLKLLKYHSFPLQREFDFGTVNLLVGANGAGKTSLLEAIELFYCGRTKRNPDSKSPYKLRVHFQDGSPEEVSNDRPLHTFRERNLAWYGIAEAHNTNNLYQSFARFNFLNTDAAVNLTETTDTLQQDLSKLLVGPEASSMWRKIERVSEAVEAELRSLTRLAGQTQAEIEHVHAQLEDVARITPESDALKTRLKEMLHRVGWPVLVDEKQKGAADLVRELSELTSVIRQAADLSEAGSPVTLSAISSYRETAKALVRQAGSQIGAIEEWRKKLEQLVAETTRIDEGVSLVEAAKRIYDAGVPQRSAEIRSLREFQQSEAIKLAGIDPDEFGRLPKIYLSLSVLEGNELATIARSQTQFTLAERRQKLADFNRLREESLRLAEELRAIAGQLLQKSSTPDQCPLCHTQFGKGELEKHIHLGLNEQMEALGQDLLKGVRECEATLSELVLIEATVARLRRYCDAASLSATVQISTTLAEVEEAQGRLAEATHRDKALQAETVALEAQGISMAALETITTRLGALGYRLEGLSGATVADLLATITGDRTSLTEKLKIATETVGSLEQALRITLAMPGVDFEGLKQHLAQTKERLTLAETLLERVNLLTKAFPWPVERPLAELVVEADSVRKVAVDLQVALEQERQRLDSYSRLTERKRHLEAADAELQEKVQRLTTAQSTLHTIQTQHSLDHAMETALQQNRATVDAIFSRIHAPAEFLGLDPSGWNTLIRKADKSKAGLTQISTGQRAAFALSIFLAQNAQLATGTPPVILIDDPIAHVDDLNSLSFLDYLRELVLVGNRQLFFATASDKLASIFQRKFDFLGKEFRKIPLSREVSNT